MPNQDKSTDGAQAEERRASVSFGTGAAWQGALGRQTLDAMSGSSESRPSRVGDVRIEAELGRGGMGRVYRGYDESLERTVAVKTIRAEHRFRAASLERFRREARLLSRLNHPGICQVYRIVEQGDELYLVMEYVDGKTLREVIDQPTAEGGLDRADRLKLALLIARALAVAHGRGVVHRDLKPENILVDQVGAPKILDFGIARSLELSPESEGFSEAESESSPETKAGIDENESVLTALGTVVGTVPYMSPEQARAEAVTDASDVFSFGLILSELLTGVAAYPRSETGSESDDALLRRVSEGKPKPPVGAPRDAAELIGAMTRPAPEERPTAREVWRQLELILDAPQRRRKTWLRGLAVAAVLIMVGSFVYSRLRLERQADLAQLVALEVKELEARMRSTYLLPPHDVQPEKQAALQRLEELERTIRSAGSVARGPGQLALAQGFLAVGEAERARRLMADAWQRGYRPPEVSYTYGVALGRLLERNAGAWSGASSGGRVRAEKVREHRALVSQQAKDVAELLATGVESGASAGSLFAEYPSALLAFYQGDLDEALRLARSAARRASWLHQARVLEGQVLKRMSEDLRDEGKYEESLTMLREADSAYALAQEVGESDPEVYEARCDLAAREMQLVLYGRGGDLATAKSSAVETCEQALLIDASRASTHYVLASVNYRWVESQANLGVAAPVELERVIEHANRAIELDPTFDLAFSELGTAYYRKVRTRRDAGLPAELGELQLGIDAVKRATELNPQRAEHWNWLGLIQGYWAQELATTGDDPIPMFEQAAASFDQATRQTQGTTYVYNNLGRMLLGRARYERGQGRDERVTLQAAVEALERSTEINPSNSFALNNQGDTYIAIGRASSMRGESPIPSLRQALTRLRQALAVQPDYASPLNNIGLAYWRLGQWQRLYGEDLDWSFDEAASAVARAAELAPGAFQPHVNLGRLACLEAQISGDQGGDPRGLVEAALEHYRAALERRSTYDTARIESGKCALMVAGWLGGQPALAPLLDPWLARATAFGKKVLEHDAGSFDANLLMAAVERHRAQQLVQAVANPATSFAEALRWLELAREGDGAAVSVSLQLETARLHLDEGRWYQLAGGGPIGPSDGGAKIPLDAVSRGLAAVERALQIHPGHPQALELKADLRSLESAAPATRKGQ